MSSEPLQTFPCEPQAAGGGCTQHSNFFPSTLHFRLASINLLLIPFATKDSFSLGTHSTLCRTGTTRTVPVWIRFLLSHIFAFTSTAQNHNCIEIQPQIPEFCNQNHHVLFTSAFISAEKTIRAQIDSININI